MSDVTHWNLGGMNSGNLRSIQARNSLSLILLTTFTAHTWNTKHIYSVVLFRCYVNKINKPPSYKSCAFSSLTSFRRGLASLSPKSPNSNSQSLQRKINRGFLSAFTLHHKQTVRFEVDGQYHNNSLLSECLFALLHQRISQIFSSEVWWDFVFLLKSTELHRHCSL